MDASGGGNALRFAGWRFDPILATLSRRESSGAWRAVPLGSRALGILGLLLEQRGAVVSKEHIIRAVWPATTVEPNNLTVQIAALRRVLDEGHEGDSLIQTVPGQGYRLACGVESETNKVVVANACGSFNGAAPSWRDRLVGALSSPRRRALAAGGALLAVLGALLAFWNGWSNAAPTPPPWVVSVSFEDVSDGQAASPLARSLTNEVATDLARFHLFGVPRNVVTDPGPLVTNPARLRVSAARYALQGSLHRLGPAISLDAQLVDIQTGVQLWAQQLDLDPAGTLAAHRDAVRRIVSGAGPVSLPAEVHRRQQKRPDRPTATDLVLQARLAAQLPPSPQRLIKVRDLLERALQLDPSSIIVKGQLAGVLMDSEDYTPTGLKSVVERTGALISDVRTAMPNSRMALQLHAAWLIWQDERCPETIEAARRLLDLYPDTLQAYRWLGRCLERSGRAEEALPWLERAIQIAGVSPWQFMEFRNIGDAMVDLGRFKEALDYYQRGLGSDPDLSTEWQSFRFTRIAIAQALDGNVADAHQTMTRALTLWPYWTARGESHYDTGNPLTDARVRRLQEGLRLAGLRDHADEEADFGVAPITTLQQVSSGYTSLTVPGATTLRTAEVAQLVAGGKAIILDTVSRNSGPSLPGAIGLRYVGAGGSLSDLAQDHLRRTMQELTKGDPTAPILAVGWNSERFDGTNLALRLVALGYRNVFWYRGGREAWEVSGAPETPLTVRDW